MRRFRWWLLPLIVLMICSAATLAWYFGLHWDLGIDRCNPPPSIMVDGVASASVLAWNDVDGDGILSPGEPPLPGVLVTLSYETATTDDQGNATVSLFKPGCACSCWESEVLTAQTPTGYEPTTPLSVNLTDHHGVYYFGFSRP